MKLQASDYLRRLLRPLFLLSALVMLRAETATITPSADTTLFEESPNNNMGAVRSMIGGKIAHGYTNRALIKFDIIGNIPSNAIIDSVNLAVTVVKAHATSGVESDFELHRVFRDWGEGNKTDGFNLGQPATANEATWNARLHGASLWSTPGAKAGTDYSATVSGSQLIGSEGSYTFGSTAELVADVQFWLTNASSNFGWILISRSEDILFTARRFGSREDPPNAPRLVVQYSLPPPPARISLVERAGTNVNLHFTAEATFCYEVQFRDSLTGGSWSSITNICAPISAQDVVVSDSLSASPQRFYRLSVTGQVR